MLLLYVILEKICEEGNESDIQLRPLKYSCSCNTSLAFVAATVSGRTGGAVAKCAAGTEIDSRLMRTH